MGQVFISHVEEDADVALAIAQGLEAAGYRTWCYERDALPGPSYLLQTARQIENSDAVVLVISPHSLGSHQVTSEVVRAHESSRPFIPVLVGISHVEFGARQPEWREAVGSATSITLPATGAETIVPRIVDGLHGLGIAEGNGKAARPDAPVFAAAPAGERSVAATNPRRRAVAIAIATAAVLVVAGLVAAALAGGGDGDKTPAETTATTVPSTPTGGGGEEAGEGSGGAETAATEFASARDTPVSTSAGALQVSGSQLVSKACPPPGIPGECLTASGSDRYLVLHLAPAQGGSAAMTQVFAMEAHESSLTFGGGLRAGTYSVSLDSSANRIEIVYGVLPVSAVGAGVLLEWPGNQPLLLDVTS